VEKLPALLRISRWQVHALCDAPTFLQMNSDMSIIWIIAAAIILTMVVGALTSYFSPEAKADRRRRKNNAPVVNTARRPAVKLSVRTEKK
jgi:hypothetical protein